MAGVRKRNGDCDMSDEEPICCMKLEPAEHIAAYLENRELLRDTITVECDQDLVNDVISNYIIVKQILSNLSWQDKLLSKHVCSVWHSAINALKKEQYGPQDFSFEIPVKLNKGNVVLKKSGNFCTEPLVVITFTNTLGFSMASKCQALVPSPCQPACGDDHSILDVVQQLVCAPKNCMLTTKSCYNSYMPLPQSSTYSERITKKRFMSSSPFIGGLYIPTIPNVDFNIVNIKTNSDMKKDFYDVVDKIARTRIVRGALVYITDKYLLHSVEEIVFLNYFKDVQPDIPYALGGCIVEDTMFEETEIHHVINTINKGKDYISENLISIGLFTVPKVIDPEQGDHKCNFDMYSVIIDSSEWSKPMIEGAINQFSREVPRYEHTVALKLSCVGRDQKHEVEQEFFQAAFPNTRLIGCYGNGELGLNHPPRPDMEEGALNAPKRSRNDPGPQHGIMYSYSTVFLYMGWGRKL